MSLTRSIGAQGSFVAANRLAAPFFGPGAPFEGAPDILGYGTRPSGFASLRRGLARLNLPAAAPMAALGPLSAMGAHPAAQGMLAPPTAPAQEDALSAAALSRQATAQQFAAQQMAAQQMAAQQAALQQWAAQAGATQGHPVAGQPFSAEAATAGFAPAQPFAQPFAAQEATR